MIHATDGLLETGGEADATAWPLWSRATARGVDAGRPNGQRWADLFVSDRQDGELAYRLRWCDPGTFLMGSSRMEQAQAWYWARQWDSNFGEHRFLAEGRQQHMIQAGFWLGEGLVSRRFWLALCPDEAPWEVSDLPANGVSWDDIDRRFLPVLRRLHPGAALPSEAQWEYACRAGSATATNLGTWQVRRRNLVPGLSRLAWYAANGGGRVHDVRPGQDDGPRWANPWGFHDLLGHLWEWCSDPWAVPYGGAGDDTRRPRRGGSAWCVALVLRAARRGGELPANRHVELGFRLCVLPSPQGQAG